MSNELVRRVRAAALRVLPVASAVVLGTGGLAAQQPAACSDPRHHDFDFWIGEWEVRVPNGNVAGRNVIERILGGCALREQWTSARAGGEGTSLNFWDRADGRWHQVWIDAQGQPLRLSGGLRDGSMVMEGTTPDSTGRAIPQRLTWTPLPDGRVRQHWERSLDERRSWQTVFDGMYTRVRR